MGQSGKGQHPGACKEVPDCKGSDAGAGADLRAALGSAGRRQLPRLGLGRPALPGALLALLAQAVCLWLACDTCPYALATAHIFLIGVAVRILE